MGNFCMAAVWQVCKEEGSKHGMTRWWQIYVMIEKGGESL